MQTFPLVFFFPVMTDQLGKARTVVLEGGGRGRGEREEEGSSGSCNPLPQKKPLRRLKGLPPRMVGCLQVGKGTQRLQLPEATEAGGIYLSLHAPLG